MLCFFALGRPVYAGGNDDDKGNTKTFTVSKGGTLDVSVNVGDIHILTTQRNEVTVTADFEEDEDNDDLKIRQKGNAISVRV